MEPNIRHLLVAKKNVSAGPGGCWSWASSCTVSTSRISPIPTLHHTCKCIVISSNFQIFSVVVQNAINAYEVVVFAGSFVPN